jgi:hypothetical protein
MALDFLLWLALCQQVSRKEFFGSPNSVPFPAQLTQASILQYSRSLSLTVDLISLCPRPALLVLTIDLFSGSEQRSEYLKQTNSGPVGMDPRVGLGQEFNSWFGWD